MTEKETCVESETTMVSTYHRIGIFQNQFTKVLHDGISRIGLPEVRIVTTPKEIENYQCDIVLLADDDTSMWKEVYEMCEYLNIPVMFIFNFGIGSSLEGASLTLYTTVVATSLGNGCSTTREGTTHSST